jgi:ParB-like chromosome segregation protein Spo0J
MNLQADYAWLIKKFGVRQVPLENIRLGAFYVRAGLDPARVEFFMDLYTSTGATVPPLLVLDQKGGNYDMIDGRNRHRALMNLGEANASVVAVPRSAATDVDLIWLAYELNDPKGAQPPTKQDLICMAITLLEAGQPEEVLRARLRKAHPREFADEVVRAALSGYNRKRIEAACDLVAKEGYTVEKAADKLGLKQRAIQDALVRRRRKNQGRHDTYGMESDAIVAVHNSAGKRLANVWKRVTAAVKTGEMNHGQALRLVRAHTKWLDDQDRHMRDEILRRLAAAGVVLK